MSDNIPQGWQCPVYKRIHAPHVDKCDCGGAGDAVEVKRSAASSDAIEALRRHAERLEAEAEALRRERQRRIHPYPYPYKSETWVTERDADNPWPIIWYSAPDEKPEEYWFGKPLIGK